MPHESLYLRKHPILRTRSVKSLLDTLARQYARPTVDSAAVPMEVDAEMNLYNLDSMSVVYCAFGAPVSLHYPAASKFLQIIPLQGTSEIRAGNIPITIDRSCSAAISPGMELLSSHSGGSQRILLDFDGEAMTKTLVALIDEDVSQPLRMDMWANVRSSAARRCYADLLKLVDVINGDERSIPRWWVLEREQSLMVMFLFSHRHNYSHLLERGAYDSPSWQIRRVEDYIYANWNREIALDTLVDISGARALDLYRAFKKHHGCSLSQYIDRVRRTLSATRI